jgi:hypothetical protein
VKLVVFATDAQVSLLPSTVSALIACARAATCQGTVGRSPKMSRGRLTRTTLDE